jgi:hypothetical protein
MANSPTTWHHIESLTIAFVLHWVPKIMEKKKRLAFVGLKRQGYSCKRHAISLPEIRYRNNTEKSAAHPINGRDHVRHWTGIRSTRPDTWPAVICGLQKRAVPCTGTNHAETLVVGRSKKFTVFRSGRNECTKSFIPTMTVPSQSVL